jgi:ketosteroid isomerase-like protein
VQLILFIHSRKEGGDMTESEVRAWMEGYIKAWSSNDRDDIGQLFTSKGNYFTAPYRQPWSGRENIINGWLDHKDEPGEYEFDYEIMGVSGDTGFVRGWTSYVKEDKDYSNLWVIRLDDNGQCYEFIEWWMRNR